MRKWSRIVVVLIAGLACRSTPPAKSVAAPAPVTIAPSPVLVALPPKATVAWVELSRVAAFLPTKDEAASSSAKSASTLRAFLEPVFKGEGWRFVVPESAQYLATTYLRSTPSVTSEVRDLPSPTGPPPTCDATRQGSCSPPPPQRRETRSRVDWKTTAVFIIRRQSDRAAWSTTADYRNDKQAGGDLTMNIIYKLKPPAGVPR